MAVEMQPGAEARERFGGVGPRRDADVFPFSFVVSFPSLPFSFLCSADRGWRRHYGLKDW